MNYPIDELHLFTLNVGFAYHNADWNWKNVRSPFARLYLVTEGEASVQLPSGEYPVTPGHLYFIPAFTTHNYVCGSTFAHYYLHIYEKRDEGAGILDEWDLPFEVASCQQDLELLQRLAHLNPFLKLPRSNPEAYDNQQTLVSNFQLNVRRPFCDKVESRGILFILLSRFLKYATPRADVADSRIRQVLVHIRRHIGESLDLDELAELACMSKDHFIRTFKKEVGETPNVFLVNRKMEEAELLLVTTDCSVKQVALRLGYEDGSYFNKLFKKYAGMTPQQYREAHWR
ncbi:MAG: AraC family transcriptional regulator [Bacteroidales bacterium]|nr:AraC family transcriptional regulator [Bacteroidales bacterium]